MRIGIGLPNTLPGTSGELMREWAVCAEENGFHFLSTIGRVFYPSYDSLISLAVAAGATRRIGLQTNVLLGPTRSDLLLAKAVQSLQQLSGGRLTLGLGIGARPADYHAAEKNFHDRGRRFDRQLEALRRAGEGDPTLAPGQAPVPLLIGGLGPHAWRRVARYGVGWTTSQSDPAQLKESVKHVLREWKNEKRDGEPRVAGLVYFAIGEEAASQRYLAEYYQFAGERAAQIEEAAVRTPEAIQGALKRLGEAGVTELVFTPSLARLDQVTGLAECLRLSA